MNVSDSTPERSKSSTGLSFSTIEIEGSTKNLLPIKLRTSSTGRRRVGFWMFTDTVVPCPFLLPSWMSLRTKGAIPPSVSETVALNELPPFRDSTV